MIEKAAKIEYIPGIKWLMPIAYWYCKDVYDLMECNKMRVIFLN